MECKTSSIQLKEIVDFGGLLVTANRRLALYHQNRFNLAQIDQNRSCWSNPNILPLRSWLQNLWQENIQQNEILLSDWQETRIWVEILEKQDLPLLNLESTALLVKSAYETLLLWNRSLSDLAADPNEQVQHFISWAKEFEAHCIKQNFCTYAQSISPLQKIIPQLTLPSPLFFDGFDDFSPSYQNILSGKAQEFYREEFLEPKIKRHAFENTEEEIRSMARWAKAELEKNKKIKIGCIVPNLSQIRNAVECEFNHVFCENHLFHAHEKTRPIFNLSAGKSLIQYDIIRIAKGLMDLIQSEINLENLGAILQSPYLTINKSDSSLGALCHVALLKLGTTALPLAELFVPLTEYFKNYPQSTWLSRFRHFSEKIKNLSARKPSLWANFFTEILSVFQWPGSRPLDSLEYQLAQRLFALFFEFSSLDLIYAEIPLKKAREIFFEALNNTIFQAQSAPANIQILGTLESAGFQFDAIWIMGLEDESWPATPQPNPFLPYDFQRQNNMPHASAARELHFAQQVLHRLMHAASVVIVSSPLHEGDKELRPCELISEIPLSDFELPENEFIFLENLEHIEDYWAPPITETEKIRGGSWILKQQSICPFLAFASVRLAAEPLCENQLGLNPAERGTLLHRCLETIWRELKNQAELKSKNQNDLEKLIENSVERVISKFANQNVKPAEKFLKTEKIRLSKIILQWLELEKNRKSFEVVATENPFSVKMGNLDLRVQVDRIDRLSSGQYVVIDYKTGSCHVNDWMGERPLDPQLPLYCRFTQYNSHSYSGLCFAEIKAGKMQFKGLIDGSDETQIPGVFCTDSWDAHLQEWQIAIEKLSHEFSNGLASVTPQDPVHCEYCELKSLCRISASSACSKENSEISA